MIIYVQYLLYKLHLMTFNYSTTMGDRRTMELLETFSEQYSSIYIVLQYQSKWTIKISIVANALGNYLSSNWNSYLVTVFHIYKILSGWSNYQIWCAFLTCWKLITFCETPFLNLSLFEFFLFFVPSIFYVINAIFHASLEAIKIIFWWWWRCRLISKKCC